jgi:hypothetical protein
MTTRTSAELGSPMIRRVAWRSPRQRDPSARHLRTHPAEAIPLVRKKRTTDLSQLNDWALAGQEIGKLGGGPVVWIRNLADTRKVRAHVDVYESNRWQVSSLEAFDQLV